MLSSQPLVKSHSAATLPDARLYAAEDVKDALLSTLYELSVPGGSAKAAKKSLCSLNSLATRVYPSWSNISFPGNDTAASFAEEIIYHVNRRILLPAGSFMLIHGNRDHSLSGLEFNVQDCQYAEKPTPYFKVSLAPMNTKLEYPENFDWRGYSAGQICAVIPGLLKDLGKKRAASRFQALGMGMFSHELNRAVKAIGEDAADCLGPVPVEAFHSARMQRYEVLCNRGTIREFPDAESRIAPFILPDNSLRAFISPELGPWRKHLGMLMIENAHDHLLGTLNLACQFVASGKFQHAALQIADLFSDSEMEYMDIMMSQTIHPSRHSRGLIFALGAGSKSNPLDQLGDLLSRGKVKGAVDVVEELFRGAFNTLK